MISIAEITNINIGTSRRLEATTDAVLHAILNELEIGDILCIHFNTGGSNFEIRLSASSRDHSGLIRIVSNNIRLNHAQFLRECMIAAEIRLSKL